MAQKQKYTEARKIGNQKWDADHLDRMSIAFPKGTKDKIKEAALQAGESMNQFIFIAVNQRLVQDQNEQAE